MSTLAQEAGAPLRLWLGAAVGDGVYRSVDGGLNWGRVHDGLGAPGGLEGEDGLSGITDVRAFAFHDAEIWMAGYRGGVYWLNGAAAAWVQSSVKARTDET